MGLTGTLGAAGGAGEGKRQVVLGADKREGGARGGGLRSGPGPSTGEE